MPEGEKHWGCQNPLGVPLVKGGQNLPPMVGIGLTDLPNIGGGGPLAPLAPPVPASLILKRYNEFLKGILIFVQSLGRNSM